MLLDANGALHFTGSGAFTSRLPAETKKRARSWPPLASVPAPPLAHSAPAKMSWLVGSLVGRALDAVSTLSTGFVPQVIAFEGLQVVTTALLAEGGYSFVYLAREVSTGGKTFAVKKVLAQDKETREIAEIESRLLKQLNGTPGFVGCFGTTHREATAGAREYFMLLEFCPNGSLIDLVYRKDARTGAYARGPALSQERILEVFETVCESVAHLHALSPPVCHRDLKLENVLCTEDGRFVLCDFGSATTRVLPEGRSRREAAAEEERIAKYSTQMYRAPEMLDLYLGHAVDVRVDVWALGCILYTLCFGAHPFPAESSLQILNLAYSIPPSSQYSESVHDLVRAMLSMPPAERPSSAELLERVRAIRNRRAGTAAPAAPAASPPAASRTRAATGSRGEGSSSEGSRGRAGASCGDESKCTAATATAAAAAVRQRMRQGTQPNATSSPSQPPTRAPTRAGKVDPELSYAPLPLASPAFEAAFEAAFEPTFEAAFERRVTLRTAHPDPAADADTTKNKGGLLRACIDFDVGPWERAVKRLSEEAALLEADERRLFLRHAG